MEKDIVLTVDLIDRVITYQRAGDGIPFAAPIRMLFFENDTNHYGQVVIDGIAREFTYNTIEKTGILHESSIKLFARHVNLPTKS